MYYVVIEAIYPRHTLIRASSYIYNVFQHLLMQPVVIRMQPQPEYMLGLTVIAVVGDSLGSSLAAGVML
jgi:hypothetical protein